MGLEQRRTQLMTKSIEWGDSPSPPHFSKVDWGSVQNRTSQDRQPHRSSPLSSTSSNSQRSSSVARDSPLSSRNQTDELSEGDDVQLAPIPDDLIMMDRQARKKLPSKPQDSFTCKGWTLDSLLSKSKNFHPVPRVRSSPSARSTAAQIKRHDDTEPGVPLVVEGFHKHPEWLRDKFTPGWFQNNSPETISVRNVHDRTDKDITLSDFIARARAISPFKTPDEKERLYGKDVPCPARWNEFLHSGGILPPYLAPDSPENLLNNLPKQHRPETLMCYIGVGDTFTPCHKDLCASSGHNLMCYTEKGGSSFWFMTATSSANAAAEYFQNKLKQVLDHETHVITVDELANAPFKIYITEQKLGDLVLVPPRSMHQVVNTRGITIKTSWSRMTLDGLSLALKYELPLYRRVCRVETYRVKANIYHTLMQTVKAVSDSLSTLPEDSMDSRNAVASTSQKDRAVHLDTLRRVLLLFDSILIEEYSPEAHNMRHLASAEDDEEIEQLSCDFCGGDIFLSFFECRSCVDGKKPAAVGSGFIVCPGCYVEGRTCNCEVMHPMQCRLAEKLFRARARAVDLFNACSELLRRKTDSIPSNQDLRKDGRIGLFQAALVLRRRRLKMKPHDDMKRCTVRNTGNFNHDTPEPWILLCRKCHASSCFAHMVWKSQLHSAEALLASDKDVTGAVLHEAHLASYNRFLSEIATLKREDPDYVPDLRVQLAYLAITFSTCRPINPNSSLWKTGHYDLKAWEITLPKSRIAKMPVKPHKSVIARPASENAKRFVMECVLMPPVSRPAKRKERAGKPASPAGTSVLQAGVQADDDDDVPLKKRPKLNHSSRGPPGIRDSAMRKQSAAGPSRAKNVILLDSSSSSSDSEDERPLKRPRVTSRISKPVDLRFQKRGPQAAASVADAFNTASVQNSKAIPNTVRPPPLPASPSASAPLLPQKKTKRKSVSISPAGLAEGSNTPPSLPASQDPLAGPLAQIMQVLSTVQETQAQQAAEVRELRRVYAAHAPENVSDSATAIERQSLSTETTVKVVADLVNGLVSALTPQAAPPSSSRYPTVPSSFASQSRSWASTSRGRGRGRTSGIVFGDHSHRSTASRDILSDYRPTRHQQYGHHVAPFPASIRHADAPGPASTRGGYYEQRIWIPGPHGQERHEERGPEERARYRVEDGREPKEPTRKRRKFTRFSPPNSPGNGLDLVLSGSRSSRPPPPSRLGRFEDETGSEANETAESMQLFRRQTPRAGNARGETSSGMDKFFRTLTGRSSRSPTPMDDQDWETRYEKDAEKNT